MLRLEVQLERSPRSDFLLGKSKDPDKPTELTFEDG